MGMYGLNGDILRSVYDCTATEQTQAYDTSGRRVTDPYLENRLLIFEDNFSSIDADSWRPEVGHMRGDFFCRENNIEAENDSLAITIRKENHAGQEWTSGSLITRGKKSWMYGRFEAKIKATGINYFNSAFWFLGNSIGEIFYNDDGTWDYTPQGAGVENRTGWSECGEIDVLETQSNIYRPTCNLWDDSQASLGGGEFPSDIDTTKWHVYAMEWTSTYIAMYVDDVEYKRWNFSDYSADAVKAYTSEPMAIYLGVGTNPWVSISGVPNEGTMYVDWVRVYAEPEVTQEILDQSISIQETMRLKKGYVCYTAPVILPLNTSDRSITWISEDESIVRCDNGFIYGIELGEADIYVISSNNHISRCHVTVIDPSDPIIIDN